MVSGISSTASWHRDTTSCSSRKLMSLSMKSAASGQERKGVDTLWCSHSLFAFPRRRLPRSEDVQPSCAKDQRSRRRRRPRTTRPAKHSMQVADGWRYRCLTAAAVNISTLPQRMATQVRPLVARTMSKRDFFQSGCGKDETVGGNPLLRRHRHEHRP